MAIFASVGRVSMPPVADERLKIKANAHGVEKGWFHFPFNFDPIWLDNCEGFEQVTEKDARVINKHRAKDGEAENCEQTYFCEECPERFECFTEREKKEK